MSREILLLISIAMVLDKSRVDQVIEMVNKLLDAGGYKQLRERWNGSSRHHQIDQEKKVAVPPAKKTKDSTDGHGTDSAR